MKTVGICAAVILAALWAGQAGGKTDIAKLRPIEVVHISQTGSNVTIETDTQDLGCGSSVQDALENLRMTASGEVFFETADYLIAGQETLKLVPELIDVLRPNCKICICEDIIDLQQAAGFLQVHEPESTLREYAAGMEEVAILTCAEGKMQLVQK